MNPFSWKKAVNRVALLVGCTALYLITCTKTTDNGLNNTLDNPPQIKKIMSDATVGVGDSVVLSVVATAANGKVDRFFWKSSLRGLVDSTEDSLCIVHYNQAGRDTLSIYVRDNKGVFSDTALVFITVHSWAPYIRTQKSDTMVHAGDTVYVTVAASDTNSPDSLLRYLWAVNSGSFKDTTRENRLKIVCSETDIYRVFVKILDPQGQVSATDTILVLARGNAPIILGPSEGVQLPECHADVVFSPGWRSKYFKVLFDTTSPPQVVLFANMKDTSFALELESQSHYYLRIISVDSLGKQDTSAVRSFATPLCGDAYLKSIGLSSGVLRRTQNKADSSFDERTYDYEIHLADTSLSVKVTPVLDDPSAAITVNDVAWASGRQSNLFKIGQTIKIAITSGDGKSLRTYSFLVRLRCSNEARCAGLTAYSNSGALSYHPSFNPDTTTYLDTVINEFDTLWFVPRLIDPKASVWVKNEKLTSGTTSSGVWVREGLDTVPITVLSECSVDTVKYRFIVRRLPSSNASLKSMSVSAGSLLPLFNPDTLTYTDTLANALDTVTIVPVVNDPTALVIIGNDTVASAGRKKITGIQVGPNTVTVKVVAADRKTMRQYILLIYRKPDSNTLLSLLDVSAGKLNPAFSSGIFEYRDTIAFSIDSIAVKAKAANGTCKLRFNDVLIKPDTFSSKIYLAPALVCTLKVKATLSDGSQETMYRILAYRLGNSESRLTSLSGAPNDSLTLTPAFKDTVYLYKDTVPNYRKSVTIIATPSDQNSIVTINNDTVNNQHTVNAISLSSGGLTTITIKVYAQDKVHVSTYTVSLWREAAFDAFLGNMAVSRGTLQPPFRFDQMAYDLAVDDTVAGIYLTPTARDSNATIRVSAPSITNSAVKTGTLSPAIPLTAGYTDTIKVIVTAENGVTMNTYKIAAYKKAKNDAHLSGLDVSVTPGLKPAFAENDTMYFDTVLNRIDTVRVKPYAKDFAGAKIYVNGTPVTHGMWSGLITLASGNNAITVRVLAEDQTSTKSYYANIYRDPRSDNAALSSITTSGKLRPAFSSAVTLYRDTIDAQDTAYSITAVTSSPAAALRINSQLTASGTARTIKTTGKTDTVRLLVTAENPATSQEFMVLVSPGGNARLTSLTASAGALVPPFDQAIVDYTDTVAFAVESLFVTPTSKDPLAGTKVNGVTVMTGTGSPKFPLNVGPQTITVDVTASSGGAQKEYRIAVVRMPLDTNILLSPSNNTLLSGWNLQTFTWKNIPGCTFAFAYYNAADMTLVGSSQSYSTDTTFVLNNLPGNKRYVWGVGTKDWHGNLHASPGWFFSTRNHPPTVPTLSAPADTECFLVDSTTDLHLTWTASTGQDVGETVQYLVGLGKANPPSIKTSGLTITQYTNQTLLDTGKYFWRIGAMDGIDTTYSATKCIAVFDSIHLTNINIGPASGTALTAWNTTLVWNRRNGFTYIPYYGTDSTNIATALGASGTDTARALTGLTGNKTYYWRVKITKGGLTMYSPVWKFTTANHAPAAPTTLSTPWDKIVFGDIPASWTYTWSGASDADAGDVLHYNVYLGTTSPPATMAAANVPAASANITMSSMSAGTYYWQVEVSDGKDSVKSTVVNKMVLGTTQLVTNDDGQVEVVDSIYQAELDLFTYQGKAGEVIQLQVAGWQGGFDPQITFYQGATLLKTVSVTQPYSYSTNDAFLTDTLPSDGEYRITVGDVNGDESSVYQLSLVSFTKKLQNATAVSYDQTWDAMVYWDNPPAYKFTGQAGDHISIRMSPHVGGNDPELSIIAPDGTRIYYNYVNQPYSYSTNALYLQDLQLPQTGTYNFIASDWGWDESGTYSFQFLKLQ